MGAMGQVKRRKKTPILERKQAPSISAEAAGSLIFLDSSSDLGKRLHYPLPCHDMTHAYRFAAIALLSTSVSGVMAADLPLTAAELSTCAQHVEQLRAQSPQLLQRHETHNTRRDSILAQRRALDNQSMTRDQDDLARGLEIRRQRKTLNADALTLNQEVEVLRKEIAANSEVRDAYDRQCAQRPYSRNSFSKLPQSQQDAMRAGLTDIQVPELPASRSPLPSVSTR